MEVAALNEIIAMHHPAASQLLTRTGQRAALPLGIPQQAAQARNAQLRATIGEITDKTGTPLALPSVARHLLDLDLQQSLRYAPQAGIATLRQRWHDRLVGREKFPCSMPVVTSGITHALSVAGELFVDERQPLVIGTPRWDNYTALFALRTGASLISFETHRRTGDQRFNLAGLQAALAQLTGPASVLLNFPANPSGYSPTYAEVDAICEVLLRHPHALCVILDDAYAGLFYEEETYPDSLFSRLAREADPRRMLVCKADGATKELVFFGGRVGFLTFSADGPAAAALEEKASAVVRATISSASALSETLVNEALASPDFADEVQRVRSILKSRYQCLKRNLDQAGIAYVPFNSGCFALLPVPEDIPGDPTLTPSERTRLRLLSEHSVGVISVPPDGIRVAFCSMEEADIEELVARLARVLPH